MRVLSIQSSVVYGHVGNSAAVFPLQRLGHEVWAVPTVVFAAHVGYGPPRGTVLALDVMADIMDGLGDLGVLGDVDAVLSGYQGSDAAARAVLAAVQRVRSVNPAARYCCDPVIGDWTEGVYAAPGLTEVFRDQLVPAADIVTPNTFELELLTGRRADDLPGLVRSIDSLHALGPRTVLVTSVGAGPVGPDEIGMLASGPSGRFLVRSPLLPVQVKGTGDVATALFLAHADAGLESALARVASTMHAVLTLTAARDAPEMTLVQAQQAIADPRCEFEVVRVD